ncbi:MAG: hypothetical protein MUF12_02950 [Sediminibacterium sp.]|nr:hypothetical protein [Sediminibacterium sp.]
MFNDLHHNDLESLLREELDSHRMYPSDKVWSKIRASLHQYKPWHALTFISIVILTALSVLTIDKNHEISFKTISSILSKPKNNEYVKQISAAYINEQTFQSITQQNKATAKAPEKLSSIPIAEVVPYHSLNIQNPPSLSKSLETITEKFIVDEDIWKASYAYSALHDNKIELNEGAVSSYQNENLIIKSPANNREVNIFPKDLSVTSKSYMPRWGFQWYVTPSMGFRDLTDDRGKNAVTGFGNFIAPMALNRISDINAVVRHRSAPGMEVGLAGIYHVNKRLSIKAGFQFNIQQYFIETFQSNQEIATVSLFNGFNRVDNIHFLTRYNNATGFYETTLRNRLFQLSLPVGIQWNMLQGKRLGIQVEATVQPTINLNDNVYLISTDYKNYTEGASLLRKTNLNSSIGVNLTYSFGNTKFEIGPHFRYQHLPTYIEPYPVREYLKNVGFRVGMTRTFRF